MLPGHGRAFLRGFLLGTSERRAQYGLVALGSQALTRVFWLVVVGGVELGS